MTDEQIIELFWHRNEDAIAETDAAYGRKLRALSHRILRNQEDAEETVSDTYLKTWESIPEHRPPGISTPTSPPSAAICP